MNRHYSPNSWKKKDTQADCFYAYILLLNDNTFYSGSTRELANRLFRHRLDNTQTTASKNPRLQYFETLPTRQEAEAREQELQHLITTKPWEIIRLISRFHTDVNQLDFSPARTPITVP